MLGGHPLILISGVLGVFDLLLGGRTTCFTASLLHCLPHRIRQFLLVAGTIVIDKT